MVARAVLVGEGFAVVADWISGAGQPKWNLEIVVPPASERSQLGLPDHLPADWSVQWKEASGFWSVRYGHWQQTDSLSITGVGTGPVVWAVGRPGHLPVLAIDEATVSIDGEIVLKIEWSPDAQLVVRNPTENLDMRLSLLGRTN
jgi:hypothetical protein